MMMEQVLYKIGEVSTRLNLVDKNNNTLRGWAEEFGEFLSASANAAPGQPRRFTERDIQILTAVRDYRANHYSYDEIRERLRAGEHDVTPPQPPEPAPAHTGSFAENGQALVPMAQVDRLLAPLAASVEEWRRLAEQYRGRLEAREERIEALEHRIEELYARLDVRAYDSSASQHDSFASQEAPAGQTVAVAVDSAHAAAVDTAQAPIPEAAPAAGPASNGLHAGGDDAAPLFPLPVVQRAPRSDVDGVMTTPAPRRPWWRVWR